VQVHLLQWQLDFVQTPCRGTIVAEVTMHSQGRRQGTTWSGLSVKAEEVVQLDCWTKRIVTVQSLHLNCL
jgi:hypothetical protein